ncbi:MAG: hypothetical protein U0946_01365 [Patescibacteria group bacterium]|jgi:hypothetical protein|nr:hypothetical protein [Patescibacteria group bacterium]
MLTLSQILLVVVVTILTILVIIFSLYIFRILDEIRKTLQKSNAIMDDMKRISKSVADPIEHASEFVSGLKQGGKLVELAGRLVDKRTDGSKHKKND